MSYNGSGVYTLPGAQLVNGEIVSATENNQFRNDVATALNTAWTRDGQSAATGNIPMGTHKFTGLAAGTGAGDSVRYEQLPSANNKLDLTTSVTGTLPVANGGSGTTTLTGIVKGNGTSAYTAAVAGTDYLAPAAIGTTVQAYAAELQGATQGGINNIKNRIINGAMMIDQRNAGASVTNISGGAYGLDRWAYYGSQASKFTVQQNAGSVTPPTGFTNYLGVTSSSAHSVGSSELFIVYQPIEGLNVADLGWGTASAATVTLSFWVRSSLTGTFGGSLRNSAANRSYPFSYTVSSANTWEQKSVTIAGDTSGTWLTTNGVGIYVSLSVGVGSTSSGTAGSWAAANYLSATGATSVVGTNGATFYITGVQLEKGSTATSFDYRPYGQELALCQRYYQKLSSLSGNYIAFGSGRCSSTTGADIFIKYTNTTRAAPTLSQSGCGINGQNVTSISGVYYGSDSLYATFAVASGLTAGQGAMLYGNNSSSAYIELTSEL